MNWYGCNPNDDADNSSVSCNVAHVVAEILRFASNVFVA